MTLDVSVPRVAALAGALSLFTLGCSGGSSGDGDGDAPGGATDGGGTTGEPDGADPAPEPSADGDTGSDDDSGAPQPTPDPEPIPAGCPDDEISLDGSNHTQQKARELFNAATYEDLVVCSGEDDWFKVFSKDGFELQFEVSWTGDDPLVSLDWFREEQPDTSVYVLGGGYLKQNNTSKITSGLWQAPGRYYARVHTKEPQAAYTAKLLFKPWKLPACTSLEVGGPCNGNIASKVCAVKEDEPDEYECVCLPDSYDSAETAAQFTLAEKNDKVDFACADDEDWYKVFLAADSNLFWRIEAEGVDLINDADPATNWGNLPYLANFEVYGPEGAPLPEGETGPAPLVLLRPFGQEIFGDKLEIAAEGVYYFRIWNVNLADTAFILTMDSKLLPEPEDP